MPEPAIATSPAQSPTLRRLLENLEAITAHLDRPDLWQGARVGDAYVRFEARDSLVSGGSNPREYAVGVHVFDQPQIGDLHDHRWPLAVYPFGDNLPAGTPLYEMPWEHGRQHGSMTVYSRVPYAIEQCFVRHAVRSLGPHMSVTLTDITDPPTRPNRLTVTALPPEEVEHALTRTRRLLGP